MDDFIKTVNFKVNPDGNCRECECKIDISSMDICIAFDRAEINTNDFSGFVQCPACVEFLIREHSKIKCSRCEHVGDYPDWGCSIGNDTENSVDCKQFVKNN
jgi:hypothetical protein